MEKLQQKKDGKIINGLALGWHWVGIGLALGWHWVGIGLAMLKERKGKERKGKERKGKEK